MILSPSILASDFTRLGEQILAAEAAGCQWLHIDVMDGVFVPNISIGFPVIESLRRVSGLVFDVHLMICNPMAYVERFVKAGADYLTLHAECFDTPQELVDAVRLIHSFGCKAGLSIKPATSVDVLAPALAELDLVLVMSVEPGYGGQSLIEDTLPKLALLRELRSQGGYSYLVEIDGGVGNGNIQRICSLGAEVIVAGTAVFGGDDIGANVKSLFAQVGE